MSSKIGKRFFLDYNYSNKVSSKAKLNCCFSIKSNKKITPDIESNKELQLKNKNAKHNIIHNKKIITLL